MSLEAFRARLDAWWTDTDARETKRKNSQGALLTFMELYQSLDADKRGWADHIIVEWLDSQNERRRFDALAMVDHFRIRAAIKQLRSHESVLAASKDHQAPYELAKIRRILVRLES